MIDNPGEAIKTWVHTWNAMDDDGETRQLHGDTEIKFTVAKSANISYGFCMESSKDP